MLWMLHFDFVYLHEGSNSIIQILSSRLKTVSTRESFAVGAELVFSLSHNLFGREELPQNKRNCRWKAALEALFVDW